MTNQDCKDNALTLSTLFEAVYNSRYRQAVLLLEAGVDVDGRNEKGQTPLITTCQNIEDVKNQIKFVKLFLDVGADPNVQDWNGLTALMHAALQGTNEVVAVLIECKRTDITIQDTNGNTALMHAATRGHSDVIFTFLHIFRHERQILGLHDKNKQGLSALQLAAKNNHDTCIFLLTREARQFPVTPLDMFPNPKILERVSTPCKNWCRRRTDNLEHRIERKDKIKSDSKKNSETSPFVSLLEEKKATSCWETDSRKVLYLPPLSTDLSSCKLFGTLASASLLHHRQDSGAGRL